MADWAGRGRLRRIHNDAAVDRQGLALAWTTVLPQAVLESAHDSFVDVLRNEASTISDHIAISACAVAEVSQRSCIFVGNQPLKLVVLVRVEASAVCLCLVPCVDFCLRSSWAAQSAISCHDVAIPSKTISPVGGVLDVLSASQLLLDVFHQCFLRSQTLLLAKARLCSFRCALGTRAAK